MKIIIKPCHDEYYDEHDAIVTRVEYLRIEADDGRLVSSGPGFESTQDRVQFVEGMLAGMRVAGVDDVRVLYDGPAKPSSTAPARLHHAEVYGDGAVFFVSEDKRPDGLVQYHIEEVNDLRTTGAVDASFYDESLWRRVDPSAWDDVFARYEGVPLVRIYEYIGTVAYAA